MTIIDRWTTDAVEAMPRVEGERYEIIDGELYVTTQPHSYHQAVCDNIIIELGVWGRQTGLGRTLQAPGLIYANDQAVAPDLIWVSKARLAEILGTDGKLHGSPELVVEIVSPGKTNEECDREKKLALYSRQGVPEYWIVDWQRRTVDAYRQEQGELCLVQSLAGNETLSSPLLPGFACSINRFFEL
ncbi:MAG TPA: Uma2 family endonuclease [Roseiflexaceae bacterium]|jgi:Uma2 family endonuclease|nr:Uma2 family endonuclease [Roseiflexaceae bacterium]